MNIKKKYIDPSADAAWAKRLGLPYDTTLLIDNLDGSVRLSTALESEIPTDTTFLKERLTLNKGRLKNTYGPKRSTIEAAIKIDSNALDALRKTYHTGEPVVIDEHSYNSRDWRDKTFEEAGITPLNLLHRYTIQYDKDNNRMKYFDTYDFDEFEDFVPGEPFFIKGSINLDKKKP